MGKEEMEMPSMSKLIEKLKAKYPKQLGNEPLMDDLMEMSGEDMEEEMPMEEEFDMEEGMEDEMENYEEEDEMSLMDEEEDIDLEGLANSPEMAADEAKKKKDLARRMSVRSKLRL